MMHDQPETTRPNRDHVYQNHHLDSTRWDLFEPRDDDIVVATSYKAGTTWMQAIVANLIFPGGPPEPVPGMSPWLDVRVVPVEEVMTLLGDQRHRRFIKTHLPLDGIRYLPSLRYIYVARDGRDVFMSLWNHYNNQPRAEDGDFQINHGPDRIGDPLPEPPENILELWRAWTTQGWFDWESEGWPYWSNLRHVQTWWRYRHLPNLLLVHFNDLLADLGAQVRRIAEFLEIPLSEEQFEEVVHATTFTQMKQNGERYAPTQFKGGTDTFLHRGTNGRWRDVLGEAELKLYDTACARNLEPQCRAWLEHGGSVEPA